MRFLSRVRNNMRELAQLKDAAEHNRKVAGDDGRPESDRVEAHQRLAEIGMRIMLLKMENDRL